MRVRGLVIVAVGLMTAAAPPSAAGYYGNAVDSSAGAQMISADYQRLEQGDETTLFAAISADGRYVVIQTRARNFFSDNDPEPPGDYRAGGLFRFDLETRALEKVADGDLLEEGDNHLISRGAFNPSISADGRYVAFTTGWQLVPEDTNENLDVYVRDMDIPSGQPGALELVSALDGGSTAATYGPPPEPIPGGEPGSGSSRGVAISADGEKVVFKTDAPSDLPAGSTPDVPPGQLFLRDRMAKTTNLITARRDPGTGEMTTTPAGGALGAAISADGTTVAWTGYNASEQTRFLGGENQDPSVPYYLWRRIADGPSASTRRVTGLSDPDDPGCPVESVTVFDQVTMGPCYGPLTDQEANRTGIGEQPPAISGDGYTVAFLTGSGPRPLAFTGVGLDLYVTDMTPGLSRKNATTELTRDPANFDPSTSSPISGISLTPNGRYLAITTVRTKFTLPSLHLVGPERAAPNARELYVVDRQEETLERVAHAVDGGDTNGAVLDGATLSADGKRVAFVSFATDLFRGDSNQRPDAFVATRLPDPEGLPEEGQGESGLAGSIEIDREGPQIGVRTRPRAGGAILVTVSVPGAGGVKALAKARAGTPRKLRTLATGSARAEGTARSDVRIMLRPVARYRAEIRERGKVRGHVSVTYIESRGGRPASVSLPVTFRASVPTRGSANEARK